MARYLCTFQYTLFGHGGEGNLQGAIVPPSPMHQKLPFLKTSLEMPKGVAELEDFRRQVEALRWHGLKMPRTTRVEGNSTLKNTIRTRITKSLPVVVALLLCSKTEAGKYREGAETFVD
jgi:hypothetical protein